MRNRSFCSEQSENNPTSRDKIGLIFLFFLNNKNAIKERKRHFSVLLFLPAIHHKTQQQKQVTNSNTNLTHAHSHITRAVRMRKVLARLWIRCSSVSLAFIVYHITNQVNTCVHDLVLIYSAIEEFTF